MFEILLTACLAASPGECRTERLPGAETLAECRALARRGAAGFPPAFSVQEYPCIAEGGMPRFTVSEVGPGVFVHKGQHAIPGSANRGDISNTGFIIGTSGVMVIDSGATLEMGKELLQAIRDETDLPVTHVVLTHAHPDHIYGAAAFLDDAPQVIAHARHSDAIRARSATYQEAMSRMLGESFAGSVEVAPDLAVADVDVVDLGDRLIDLHAHRTSHTDNDLTVFDRKTGTLFAGDLVFEGHIPALDGSLLGWIDTLKLLAETPGGRQLVPGHGPVSVEWEAAFDATSGYLDQLAEETREAVRNGTPMLQAIREVMIGAQANWLLHDEFNARNATAAFKELEWE
ncbi:MAG: quinoprotein relay system zinc metallohydrolase 2 [Pseudomonadota bacterium]